MEPGDPKAGSSQARQLTGREHSPTQQRIIGLKFDWAQPCPQEQDPVFPTDSPSHQTLPPEGRQKKQELQSCRLQKESHNPRKLIEMKRQRIISQMKKVKMSVAQSCLILQPCGL